MDERDYIKPYGKDWLDQVFLCQAARSGGVIRRQIVDVEREVGVTAFIQAVKDRHFRLIRTPRHFVVVCDSGQVEVIC